MPDEPVLSYLPTDWYWSVAEDDNRVWSSAESTYRALSNDRFKAWKAAGNMATPIPSERELSDVLAVYGLAGPFVSDDPVDYPLKRWQFKAMVAFLDVAEGIEAAIGAMPDPLERAVALARYRESDVYRREDPLFDQLAPAVGLTPADIDAAWMTIARA